MKYLKNPRIAVIEAHSATQFEYLINDKMDELAQYKPTLTIEHGRFFRAYIQYTIETVLPETFAERFEICGLYFKCGDCPQFERFKNQDGSVDKRTKYGYCKIREGRTHQDASACERFHLELLKRGSMPDGRELPESLRLTGGKEEAAACQDDRESTMPPNIEAKNT